MHDRTIDIAALIAWRARRGMTMAELSRTSGVSYSLIKYVHAGERQFSDVTAHKIAVALGCTADDFSTPGRTPGRSRRIAGADRSAA